MPHSPRASFWAAGLAQIVTRPLDERDHACGNEVDRLSSAVQAVTPSRRTRSVTPFKGQGLDNRWDDPNCRSSFVGHFAH